jgi:hypothetical protein
LREDAAKINLAKLQRSLSSELSGSPSNSAIEPDRCPVRPDLGLEGIVSKRLNAQYKSGPSKVWLKIKNPNAPAATRAVDWNF